MGQAVTHLKSGKVRVSLDPDMATAILNALHCRQEWDTLEHYQYFLLHEAVIAITDALKAPVAAKNGTYQVHVKLTLSQAHFALHAHTSQYLDEPTATLLHVSLLHDHTYLPQF